MDNGTSAGSGRSSAGRHKPVDYSTLLGVFFLIGAVLGVVVAVVIDPPVNGDDSISLEAWLAKGVLAATFATFVLSLDRVLVVVGRAATTDTAVGQARAYEAVRSAARMLPVGASGGFAAVVLWKLAADLWGDIGAAGAALVCSLMLVLLVVVIRRIVARGIAGLPGETAGPGVAASSVAPPS